MFRRLHFLLPNTDLARAVVDELNSLGVSNSQIHACANANHGLAIGKLPPASKNQARDKTLQIENIAWKSNLALFFMLLAFCFYSLLTASYMTALVCIAGMAVSFLIGNFFAKHIPHVHLYQFANALSHSEILLMVDVDNEKLAAIEENIHRHHPAAIDGGSCWTIKGMDI